jgi:hypothetical protein
MHPDVDQARPAAISRSDNDRMPPTQWIMLAAICIVALLLRLRVGINTTYLIHPDELFDYLEQGFRLAFGYGTQTWTYQDGIRSYLFPALLAAPMKLGSLLGAAPGSVLNAAAVFMSLMSLSVVAVAFLWGRRTGGTIGAVITGSLAAVWFELIYFAPHALSEVMATNFLVVAAYLCPDQTGTQSPRWRLRWLGICLGLTIVIRVQLAPAVLVILLWIVARHAWRTVFHVTMAAAVPVLAAGMLDWATYSYPFQSLFLNFWANIVGGVAHYYGGVQPFYYLIDMEIHYQNGMFAVIALACVAAGRRRPLVFLIPAAIILSHSLIGHKEYRFIYPALPFVFVLAGVATTDLVKRLAPPNRPAAQKGLAVLLLLLWSFASWAQAIEGPFRREWLRSSGLLAASRFIATLPEICGLGGYAPPVEMPGRVLINRDVPIYFQSNPKTFESDAPSFNVVIAGDDNLPPGNEFALAGCWSNGFNEASLNQRMPKVCVLTRAAQCRPGPISEQNLGRPPGW